MGIVSTYKYLGLLVSCNGNLTRMMNSRIDKATRAIFILKRALSTNYNVSTRLALTLFDKMISPVLLFGCPLWSLPQINSMIRVQISEIPVLNVKGWGLSNLKELYPALNDHSVKSIKTHRSKNEIVVEMENPTIKNCVLEHLKKRPLTFNQCCKFLSPGRPRLPVLGQGYLLLEAGSPGGDLKRPSLALYLSHRTL